MINNILFKGITRKGKLFYRRIRYRKGHGVHSPFVYNLITKVIEEQSPYYRFNDIELIRRQMLFKEDKLAYFIKRGSISPKHGALLFRLANYFRPDNILQVGQTFGLSTLYLTSYKPGVKCISLENIPEYASVSQWAYDKGARTAIDRRIGNYHQLLPGILQEMGKVDFVYFNLKNEQYPDIYLFNACIPHISDQTVFVFEGIKASRNMRTLWKEICAHEKVTVSIDLLSMGLVFLNPKLHKRNYHVYF